MSALRSRLAAALVVVVAPTLLILNAPTTARAAGSASLPVTPVAQQYPLDCEAGALQMALSAVGVRVTQDQLLQDFGVDLRGPVMRNGEPVQWGDPYQNFVGDVRGNFVATGYGVYYPRLVDAASREGASAYGSEDWQPQQLYQAVAAGHPVVVRVSHLLAPAAVGYWTAWDGRRVWYSHRDHAQTLVGFDYGAGTVTLADPLDAQLHTFTMAAFEGAFATFHSQAVVVSPGGHAASQAISPTNGSVNVAVQGPDHSLFFFWNVAGTWHGPLGIGGPNSTFSAPAIVAEASGNFDIAVQGPNNTVDMYWDTGGRWYGPYQVGGAGSANSTPSVVVDAQQHVTVAVQGPAHSMYLYWCVAAQWYGPYGLGAQNSTFSSPALSLVTASPASLQAVVSSGDAALQQYRERSDGSWSGPNAWSQSDNAYSSASSTAVVTAYMGPGSSLMAVNGASAIQVADPGTTYSAPSLASSGADTYAVVQGPGHNLSFFANHGGWGAAVRAAPAGSAYSAPSIAVEANGNIDVAVEGPSSTLFFFWRVGSTWYGPLQVGGTGTTFAALP
ncbi:MAG: C39 family peptidase [Candidatus Dormibacteraeota bacterium]|nr:C39 family peptidase [Candidatus Dormibacteraeota bacterium]